MGSGHQGSAPKGVGQAVHPQPAAWAPVALSRVVRSGAGRMAPRAAEGKAHIDEVRVQRRLGLGCSCGVVLRLHLTGGWQLAATVAGRRAAAPCDYINRSSVSDQCVLALPALSTCHTVSGAQVL